MKSLNKYVQKLTLTDLDIYINEFNNRWDNESKVLNRLIRTYYERTEIYKLDNNKEKEVHYEELRQSSEKMLKSTKEDSDNFSVLKILNREKKRRMDLLIDLVKKI